MSSFPMAATVATIDCCDTVFDISGIEETVSFDNDPLLYSVIAKRLKEEKPTEYGYLSLQYNQDLLAENITAGDMHLADTIRKFYMDRYLLANLRGDKLSTFRTDLINFLYSNDVGQSAYSITSKTVGMMYKLPYFYEYDVAVSNVLTDYNTDTSKKLENAFSLEYIAKLDMHRKKTPVFEYWFKDADNHRIAFLLEKRNPLVPMFDLLIKDHKIKIEGHVEYRTKNYNPYLFAKAWNFEIMYNTATDPVH